MGGAGFAAGGAAAEGLRAEGAGLGDRERKEKGIDFSLNNAVKYLFMNK